jgi:hypothetical protein
MPIMITSTLAGEGREMQAGMSLSFFYTPPQQYMHGNIYIYIYIYTHKQAKNLLHATVSYLYAICHYKFQFLPCSVCHHSREWLQAIKVVRES